MSLNKEVTLKTDKKQVYENLFSTIVESYPEIRQMKYSDVWNQLILNDVHIHYDEQFFGYKMFMKEDKQGYFKKLNVVFEQLVKLNQTSILKQQLLTLYQQEITNRFFSFRDYLNLLSVIYYTDLELSTFLNYFYDVYKSKSIFDVISDLSKNPKTFKLYELIINDQTKIDTLLKKSSIPLSVVDQMLIVTNLFLYNYVTYIKFLIYNYYQDIVQFIKSRKTRPQLVDINDFLVIDFTIDYYKLDKEYIFDKFYESINKILNFVILEKDEVSWIEETFGMIFYLFQIMCVINEFLLGLRSQQIFFKNYYSTELLEYKLQSILLAEDIIPNHIENSEQIEHQIRNSLRNSLMEFFRNILGIDLNYIVKNEKLVSFLFYFVPDIYVNSNHILYQFYNQVFMKLFNSYKLWILFNYFVHYDVEMQSIEENVFTTLQFGKPFYDLYLKYYFMTFYIVQDKFYVDLLNIIEDEYFYYMGDNETFKNYTINVLSHIVTQFYLITKRLEKINSVEVTILKYLKKSVSNYFGELDIDVSKTLPELVNKYIFAMITKLSNQKQTQRLMNKIIRIIYLLTNDLVVNNSQDFIQTTDVEDKQKTYNPRQLDSRQPSIFLSKTFNYDFQSLLSELQNILSSRYERNRKYIYTDFVKRNVLTLMSKFYRGISVDKLLKSNLSVLQNYNELLEVILIFTKQLIYLKPIYYEIYLEQLFRESKVGRGNIIYLFEILTSFEQKETDNPYKHIYNYQIIYPFYVHREKYLVKYVKRLDENYEQYTDILNDTHILIQEINMFRTLNNPNYQHYLKKIYEFLYPDKSYHYNTRIILNKFIFQPTQPLPMTGNDEIDGYINYVNQMIKLSPVSVQKYVNYILNQTYQIYGHKPNQIKLQILRLQSYHYQILYNSIHYRTILEPVILNSDRLYRRIPYSENRILQTFYYNNSLRFLEIVKLIRKIVTHQLTKDEIFFLMIQLLDNFLNPYDVKFQSTHEFYIWLREFVTTKSYHEIQSYIRWILIKNLEMFTSQYFNRMTINLLSSVPLNTNVNIDEYYYFNYMLYLDDKHKDFPLNPKYQDIRLKIDYEKFMFLYPKYRPVQLNKVQWIETYDWINDKDRGTQLIIPSSKYKNSKVLIDCYVVRDVIESYETFGSDLYSFADTLHGFGEFEQKPLFEISNYYLNLKKIFEPFEIDESTKTKIKSLTSGMFGGPSNAIK